MNSIVSGSWHSCAIATNSQGYCWGYNSNGQIGGSTGGNKSTPVAVVKGAMPSQVVKQISVGGYHTCAIASNDQAYCWGDSEYGEVGNGALGNQGSPVAVSQGSMPSTTVKQIVTGDYHTCAIASNDQVYCWGYNQYGMLGTGNTANSSTPVATVLGARPTLAVKSIVSGIYNVCVIATADDKPYCWGYSYLGNNSSAQSTSPVAVSIGSMPTLNVKKIAIGYYHTCVIGSDDNPYCWGDGDHGELGNNTNGQSLVPTVVSMGAMTVAGVKSIVSGYHQSCAIGKDNQTYCWGYNLYGQLGDNSTINRSLSVKAFIP